MISLQAQCAILGPLQHFICSSNYLVNIQLKWYETASTYVQLFLQTTEIKHSKGAYLSPEARRHMDPIKFTSREAKFSWINSNDLIFNNVPFLPKIYCGPIKYWFILRLFYHCCYWFVYLIFFVKCFVVFTEIKSHWVALKSLLTRWQKKGVQTDLPFFAVPGLLQGAPTLGLGQ